LGQEDARQVVDFVNEIDGKVLAGIEAVDEAGDATQNVTLPLTGNAATGKVGDVTDEEIRTKIEARQKARADKDFPLADAIRRELLDRGILLEDTKDGVRWKKVARPKS
jgi:cysteinyl-tRNA synthetase